MRKRARQIILSAGGGIILAMALPGVLLADKFWIFPTWLRILTVICAAIAWGGILYLSIGWAKALTAGYRHRDVVFGLGICMVAGLILAFVIPVRGSAVPLRHTLQFVPTTERNENSLGNEISVSAINSVGLPGLPELPLLCKGDWIYQGGAWISQEGVSTQLVCEVEALKKVNIQFRVGKHAGVVKLIIDQLPPVNEDLFAESRGIREISLSVQPGRRQTVISSFTITAVGIWIGWLLFILGLYLINRPVRQPQYSNNLPWYILAIPLVVIWLLYLIAFWPGFMNSDAQDQWQQMVTGRINDWHPAFHTLTFWLITRAWFSPAAVALVQVLILAILIGLILSEFQRKNTPLWLIGIILVILCLPPYGLAIIALWKDIPFSIAILGFTFCLLQVVESGGGWTKRALSWVGLGVIGALAALYRHNGPPGIFISLALLVMVYPRYRKEMLGALAVAALLYFGVRGPLYRAVGVPKDTTNPGLQLALAHLIAAHTKAHTPLSPEERELLLSIRKDDLVWPYDCYSNNKMAFDGNLHLDALVHSTDALLRLSIELSRRNPAISLDHFICNGAFIFRVLPPMAGRHYSPYDATPIDYFIIISQIPLIETHWPWLRNFFFYLTRDLYYSSLYWFFWRSPFWMYLLIFAVSIAVLRTARWNYLLLLAPALLNTLPLALISFVQGFRFVMPVMVVSLLFSGYLVTRDRS
jgi:hypothetical protein